MNRSNVNYRREKFETIPFTTVSLKFMLVVNYGSVFKLAIERSSYCFIYPQNIYCSKQRFVVLHLMNSP